MNKSDILNEIRRLAAENSGKAPGFQHLQTRTGITKGDWYPHIWLRWSEALQEAGLRPNTFNERHDNDYLLERYALLVRELGHRPVTGELRRKCRQDKTFPSHTAFSSRYKTSELMLALKKFSETHEGFDDVIGLCKKDFDELDKGKNDISPEKQSKAEIGYVYLMKSGKHYKIGRTVSVAKRERDIGLIIPDLPTTIHWIATDDPVGIETYWHRRFNSKRAKGEWFLLSADDVAAFKRWKKIA